MTATAANSAAPPLVPDRREALRLYREMLRIRRFEEELFAMVSSGKIGGTTHLYSGQEAVAVGISTHLHVDDQVVSTHRGHGHLLAKGAAADRAFAEIAGRRDGYCGGKGGSQHVAVPAIGHMGSNGITGGGLPLAAGLALAKQFARDRGAPGRCVVAYIGDGAAGTGNFHEVLNMAALWRLPLVVVLENNCYSMSTPVDRSSACVAFTDWAERYRGVVTAHLDGNDVLAVGAAIAPLLAHAREGKGPVFVQADTYRYGGHSKSDPCAYRSKDEERRWHARDPLLVLQQQAGLADDDVDAVRQQVEDEIRSAVAFAMQSPPGDRALALSDLTVPASPRDRAPQRIAEGTETTMTEALREALRGELARDQDVVFLGEDIGLYGGAFGLSRGLLDEFGPARVRETPISENGFTGLGVGAAMGGLRPVVELMFGDFVTCCTDALVNHAAKVQYMYAGQVRVPFTLRMPIGRRNGYGATHSQSLEGMFLNVPGLRIVCPATVPDAVGLLRGAIRSDAPVLFLEPKLLYPKRGKMPGPDHVVQLGEARVDRVGTDLTLITYGLCLELCREAADALEARGHSIEILDLRTLAPFDRAACVASIQKTGRAVVVQEASTTGGVADVVIGAVLPDVFGQLRAPLLKVGAAHCPIPSSPELEDAIMPSAREVVRTALPLLTEY